MACRSYGRGKEDLREAQQVTPAEEYLIPPHVESDLPLAALLSDEDIENLPEIPDFLTK